MSSPCSNDNRNLCCNLTIEEESETESGSFSSSTESLSTTSPAQATAEQVDNLIGGGGQSSSLESLSIASSSDDDRVCGVRVCDFSDEDDEDLQSAVEVAYVNSSGLTNRSVWGDSIRLSEILCRPVTAIPNSGGRACWLLSRGLGLSQCSSIPENHPTVRALLRAWSRFFQRSGSGSFLQIYNGDGGLFV